MNTKTFAQQARKILMRGVGNKLRYWGFDAKGNAQDEPTPLSGGYQFRGDVYDDPAVVPLWQSLRRAIKQKGFDTVVEEAAYTWFNRMMALRILSKNGYEPATLDFAAGAGRLPVLLQRAQRGTFPFLNASEQKRLQPILSDYSKDTEAFAILLVGYCHTHTLLQTVFGSIDDYTELLLPDDILAEEGFLNLLNTTDAISDEEYRKVELIGWLYQFYISEKKEEVAGFSTGGKKVQTKDLPAATQIFTPNWIVKYMVQNTVGKIWLELHPESPLKANMKYLVEDTLQDSSSIIHPSSLIKEVQQLKLLDPAVGSGHILVEGFDLLYEMYLAEYYPPEEAVESILRHNLYGLDIDKRAAQLAQFAVLLKAATRYPDVLKKGIWPNIYAMPEPHDFSRQDVLDFLGKDGLAYADKLFDALHLMQQAQNLGSIMQFDLPEAAIEFISKRWQHIIEAEDLNFHEKALIPALTDHFPILLILWKKYEAVVANPPYMGRKWMNEELSYYVDKHHSESKSDLMTVFIQVCINLTRKNGYAGIVTLDSWMFLSSYENLRNLIYRQSGIDSLLHIGWNTFPHGHLYNRGVSFCLKKRDNTTRGVFINLSDVDAKVNKHDLFLRRKNSHDSIYYKKTVDFSKIPGGPIAYWVSERFIEIFEKNKSLGSLIDAKQGIATGENDRFLRLWMEVSIRNIFFQASDRNEALESGKKWFPYNKGGQFRKWYGNHEYLLNWENDGEDLTANKPKTVIRNPKYFFKESVSWSDVTSGGTSFRYYPQGFIFDSTGHSSFPNKNVTKEQMLAYLNSKFVERVVPILNPTIHFHVGYFNNLPGILLPYKEVNIVVQDCINISINDWDSHETSWGFKFPPILNDGIDLKQSYELWRVKAVHCFFQLLENEEEINRIYIEKYQLQSEFSQQILLKDITILQEELNSKDLEALEREFRKKGALLHESP